MNTAGKFRHHTEYARENGWAKLLPRVFSGVTRRIRDGFTARRLKAPQFRAGRSPRIIGLGHMRIGKNFSAGDQLWMEAAVFYGSYDGIRFSPELIIGNDVRLSDSVHIACLQHITIGSGLLAGSRVLITDHAHGNYRGADQSSPSMPPAERPLVTTGAVHIGQNVWLGDGVVVLGGSQIGDGAIIGANSVVTGIIPPNTIAAGAPARLLRQWDDSSNQWLAVKPTEQDGGSRS